MAAGRSRRVGLFISISQATGFTIVSNAFANSFPFRSACLVVAHPDDEILWFSSIISLVSSVIVCFLGQPDRPKLARGRRAVLESYPLATVAFLGLEEAGVFGKARWPHAEPSPQGLELTGGCHLGNRRYRENFVRLTEVLSPCLSRCDAVFTHNPWGEYGHEEHVQVYRAVHALQRPLGFDLWCSAYVGSHSRELMARSLDRAAIESMTLDTQIALAREMAARYKENGAWTWFDDYAWPEREFFLRLTRVGARPGSVPVVPLNYLGMDMPRPDLADRTLRSLARKALRR
jgi:LmbE family N-acetylglucosaminyl deacetylase